MPTLAPLPIDRIIPQIIRGLEQNSSVVVRSPTGSGKTTRVPPAILDADLAVASAIVMLEPRRLAARAAARRIAWERGGQVGGEIGYAVRFDQKISAATRLKIVTDGVLLRMLLDDPFMEQSSVIVFDEFHERGLNADLALAMVRRMQQTVRPDLKIVVMSATLAAQPIAAFLGQCPIVESEGRLYPVGVSYQSHEDARPITERVADAVVRAADQVDGDILAFLPGLAEIRRTARQISTFAVSRDVSVMELYGDLSAEQQDAVLAPLERRKVVLATNVAETSVTIDGIVAVVDSGLVRSLRYEPSLGLDRLVLGKISRASADQRAGRAGRTQPGVCFRLWTERDHQARPELDNPEVQRVDVAGPVLQLLSWGELDVHAFPWFEAPSRDSLESATHLLTRLAAIANGRVTALGAAMARLPLHPRIARLLIEGFRYGHAARSALAAALLAERDPFPRERMNNYRPRLRSGVYRTRSDVLDRVVALEQYERNGRTESPVGRIGASGARHLLRTRDQLVRLVREEFVGMGRANVGDSVFGFAVPKDAVDSDEAVERAVFCAFPDRLARRREPGSRGGVVAGGRGVRLDERSGVMESELFVCVEVDAGKSESLVRQASAVERDWLASERMSVENEFRFDEATERIVSLRRTVWDGLVLDEVPVALPPQRDVAAALARAAADRIDRAVPQDDAFPAFLARVRSLRQWMPSLGLPEFDDDQLRALLPDICARCRSLAELRAAPWIDYLKGQLTTLQLQALDREAPERLLVPSGSRIALRYELGRPPVLAVRIQELFGLAETPRVAAGRVPVLLHLLAPNMRPQQVTDDLKSFWTNTYPKIRSELRRRYPKHSWPDDPWTAEPQRRPARRR